MIRCDCRSCLSLNSDWELAESYYWLQRRVAPHKYDGRARPLFRRQLQPGDCFEYVDAEQYTGGPVYVVFAGRTAHPPRSSPLWSSSLPEPNTAWPDAEVRMIRHDDPRCSWLWNDVNWPHYGSSYAAAARLAAMPLPEIDISKEAVW